MFETFELNMSQPSSRGLLVKIQSVSVNPVDTKQRLTEVKNSPRILSFGVVRTVQKAGTEVTMFREGDIVSYSGAPNQHGSDQEHQLTDERSVTRAPRNLSAEQVASLPLAGTTASETLFNTFEISEGPNQNRGKSLSIINNAGGVESITTQIAKAYNLKVITAASRRGTIDRSGEMDADIVLSHKEDLESQLEQQHIEAIDFVFYTFDTDTYYETVTDIARPRGHVVTIVAFKGSRDSDLLRTESVSLTHESMLTRPIFQTENVIKHHYYLKNIAKKIENGTCQNTTTKVINGLVAEHLCEAYQILESNSVIRKLVINIEE